MGRSGQLVRPRLFDAGGVAGGVAGGEELVARLVVRLVFSSVLTFAAILVDFSCPRRPKM